MSDINSKKIICVHVNDKSEKDIVLMIRLSTNKTWYEELILELKSRENQYHHIFYTTIDVDAYDWILFIDKDRKLLIKKDDEFPKELYLKLTEKDDYVSAEIYEPEYDYEILDLISGHAKPYWKSANK